MVTNVPDLANEWDKTKLRNWLTRNDSDEMTSTKRRFGSSVESKVETLRTRLKPSSPL
jgi:hypothetical protein